MMAVLMQILGLVVFALLFLPVIWLGLKALGLPIGFKKTVILAIVSSIAYWAALWSILWLNEVATDYFHEGFRLICEVGMFIEFVLIIYIPYRLCIRSTFLKYLALALISFTIVNHLTWLITLNFFSLSSLIK